MKEIKVLIILENAFMCKNGKLKTPVYDVSFCNTSNATYSRILKHFKDSPFTLYFGETTPYVGCHNKQKFEVNLEWVKRTIAYDDWFAVIACCKKAEDACKEIGYEPFMNLPHPASWAWRKDMIINCVTKLNEKWTTESII